MYFDDLVHKLKDLLQGSRIAFARKFRGLTQAEVSEQLGIQGDSKRRTVARYEKGDRVPKDDRLKEIANILNISVDNIRLYDFTNSMDMALVYFWSEELYPNLKLDLGNTVLEDNNAVEKFISEWNSMKNKKESGVISNREYIEWKLQYRVEKV